MANNGKVTATPDKGASDGFSKRVHELIEELGASRKILADAESRRAELEAEIAEARASVKELTAQLLAIVNPPKPKNAVNKNAPSGPAWPVKQHRRASILTALDDGGIMTGQEIADELGIKASSLSPSLTSLKQAGMIEQAGAGKWGLTAVQQKLMRESHAA